MHLKFQDGAEFVLDLLPLLESWRGNPIIEPLLADGEFQKAKLDYGTIVFPTGFDICPDVLRLWCEQGRVLSKSQTDEFFQDTLKHPEVA